MPQKQNPDVCELVRARATRVKTAELGVYDLIKGAPTGYNRDLQEAKALLMEGVAMTRGCLRIMTPLVKATQVNRKALLKGFTPDVFATDRALELVAEGMPFRDAYNHVNKKRTAAVRQIVRRERRTFSKAVARLLGVDYPVE
jgi:argininosuccinate lyase